MDEAQKKHLLSKRNATKAKWGTHRVISIRGKLGGTYAVSHMCHSINEPVVLMRRE